MIGTDLAMPVRTAFETRTGLVYERDEGIYVYEPASVFYVDGIRYDPNTRGRWTRPMLEIFDDGVSSGYATMIFSRPATEAEIDRWMQESDD
jgi:hypothetical protein